MCIYLHEIFLCFLPRIYRTKARIPCNIEDELLNNYKHMVHVTDVENIDKNLILIKNYEAVS